MMARIRGAKVATIATLSCFFPSLAGADLEPPSDRVILKVYESIEFKNKGSGAEFDLGMIESLGLTEVSTETPWTSGKVSFQGVLVRDLMAELGATGTHVTAVALDDYSVKIPLSDFDKYDAILATRREGEPMRVRDKGPIWVIYPWSEHPELQNEENYAKAIWQVRELTFE